MSSDVRSLGTGLHEMPENTNQQTTRATIDKVSEPDDRFPHIHIDIMGPLTPSNRCTYLLTCFNRIIRRPEVFLMTNITADTLAHIYLCE